MYMLAKWSSPVGVGTRTHVTRPFRCVSCASPCLGSRSKVAARTNMALPPLELTSPSPFARVQPTHGMYPWWRAISSSTWPHTLACGCRGECAQPDVLARRFGCIRFVRECGRRATVGDRTPFAIGSWQQQRRGVRGPLLSCLYRVAAAATASVACGLRLGQAPSA